MHIEVFEIREDPEDLVELESPWLMRGFFVSCPSTISKARVAYHNTSSSLSATVLRVLLDYTDGDAIAEEQEGKGETCGVYSEIGEWTT